jgi:4-hydroxy-tetrahydrodipicolinate reductase
MRLAIVGAGGKMGRALVRLGTQAGDSIAAAIDASFVGVDVGELAGIGSLGVRVTSDLEAIAGTDVVLDFSTPLATVSVVSAARRARVPLVCGTTGLSDEAKRALDDASVEVPVFWEPNMSVGVFVLGELVTQAVRKLGLGFDVEVVETHHRLKADAPSGTALRLAELAVAARDDGARVTCGREGRPGPRPQAEVGVFAVRGGDVVGDHTVHLVGLGERLELTHRATNRDVFVHGALRAARALLGKAAGRYRFADLLG